MLTPCDLPDGCVVSVRAETAITVAWAIIKDVVESLLGLCLGNPTKGIAGGIADGSNLFRSADHSGSVNPTTSLLSRLLQLVLMSVHRTSSSRPG
jgi:hypothetical protein